MRMPLQKTHKHIAIAVKLIDLIEYHQCGFSIRADLLQYGINSLNLLLCFRMAHIDDVDQQISLSDFFQSCFESLDQPMRQFANESNSIRQQHILVGWQS